MVVYSLTAVGMMVLQFAVAPVEYLRSIWKRRVVLLRSVRFCGLLSTSCVLCNVLHQARLVVPLVIGLLLLPYRLLGLYSKWFDELIADLYDRFWDEPITLSYWPEKLLAKVHFTSRQHAAASEHQPKETAMPATQPDQHDTDKLPDTGHEPNRAHVPPQQQPADWGNVSRWTTGDKRLQPEQS